MERKIKYILIFLIALSIPFIDRAYLYLSENSVDWFVFVDIFQSKRYYLYDNSSSLIIILISLYLAYISNEYVRKIALTIVTYYILNIISYFLIREPISTVGLNVKIPYLYFTDFGTFLQYWEIKFGIFHVYLIDIIIYTFYNHEKWKNKY